MEKVKFSIVICTKNRPQDINKCIESIYRQTYTPLELIIIDASDNLSTKELVEDWKHKLPFETLYISSAPGLTRQRNTGVQHCSGDVIAFFDDDVILEPGYFKIMASCFDSEVIDGATGLVTNLQRETMIKRAVERIFMLRGSRKRGGMKPSGFAAFVDPILADPIQPTDVLVGNNMLYRKSIFDHYLFDEYFDGYGMMEDVEFSHRVSKTHNLFFIKDARLVHTYSKFERINLTKHFETTIVNHFYVFRKNVKQSFMDWFFFWWSTLGIVIQCMFWTIKTKNFSAIKGVYKGHLQILKLNSTSMAIAQWKSQPNDSAG